MPRKEENLENQELQALETELTLQSPSPVLTARTPEELIERATSIAKALSDVIERQKLYTDIKGRKFVRVEGWTTLGAMLNIFPSVQWTRRIEGHGITWEARVIIQTLDGKEISSAEAMCGSNEQTWAGRGEYAIRSMAQTRAVSKALRLPLAWIMTLAGYEATPAEEMESGWQKEQSENQESGAAPWIANYMRDHALPKKDSLAKFNNNLKKANITPDEARAFVADQLKMKFEDVKFAGSSYQTLNRYNAIIAYKLVTRKQEVQAPEQPEKPKEPETPVEPTLDVETFKKLSSSLAATGLKFMVGNRSATPQIEEIIKKAHKESKSMTEALRSGLDFCAKIENWILPVKLEEELIKWGVK